MVFVITVFYMFKRVLFLFCSSVAVIKKKVVFYKNVLFISPVIT